jgi:hypothetical protein
MCEEVVGAGKGREASLLAGCLQLARALEDKMRANAQMQGTVGSNGAGKDTEMTSEHWDGLLGDVCTGGGVYILKNNNIPGQNACLPSPCHVAWSFLCSVGAHGCLRVPDNRGAAGSNVWGGRSQNGVCEGADWMALAH